MVFRARLNWLHFSVFRKWVMKDVSDFWPCQKHAMQYLDSNSTCRKRHRYIHQATRLLQPACEDDKMALTSDEGSALLKQ